MASAAYAQLRLSLYTPCDNCRHQISELNEYYGLDIKVKSTSELTVNALTS